MEEILEYFYQNRTKAKNFIVRKQQISSPKTLIKGAINSGKTYIMLDYLDKFDDKSVLYIDFSDIKAQNLSINLVNDFIKKHSDIEILALDSVCDALSVQNLPDLNSIIVATRKNSLNIPNFTDLKIHPLDLEEFIAFDRKNSDTSAVVGAFLLTGGGLWNSFLQSSKISEFEQILLKANLSQNELLVLKNCQIHQPFSANKIYQTLKQNYKISKDSVYGAVAKLEDENYINFLPKFDEENAAKKLYFSHFSFKDTLDFKKEFSKKMANALFCELLAYGDQIYYTKELDFFYPR